VISVHELREQISALMSNGGSLELVEDVVIEPCELSPDHKAALWLYAWSHQRGADQRAKATRYLASLG
jgi:hypothetical protein